jgi:hypothetical protein
MKVKDSCPGQGASRSEGCTPSQGLQRPQGYEDKLSCFDVFGLQYQALDTSENELAKLGHKGKSAQEISPVQRY